MHRGWLYVLLGLLLSSFLGGAIHVVFSPERTREFIEGLVARKQPKFDIQFTSARLQLAGEWWPSVALELQGLNLTAKDSCITNSTIQMDQLLVPLDLGSLFQDRLKFGHIRAGQVRVFLRPAQCSSESSSKSMAATATPSESHHEDSFAPLERFFEKRWAKEVVNTTRFLNRVSIRSLELLRDDQVLAPAIIQNLEMSFSAAEAQSLVNFDLKLGPPWVGAAPFGPIQTQIVIRANELQLAATGNLKEGQLRLQTDWAIDRGEVAMQLQARDVPANGLIPLFHHWNYLPTLKPNMKNQWLSCDLGLTGEIRSLRDIPITMHQCRLYGDFGEVPILSTTLPTFNHGGALRLQIQDADIKRILASLGYGQHWGVVSQFGRFSGEMIVDNSDTYRLKGEVRRAEFYFRSDKQQVRQKLDSFQLSLTMDGKRFTGRVSDFSIEDGSLEGDARFELTPEGDGQFRVAFQQVTFPLEVQKVIWGGRVTDFSLVGQGQVQGSAVTQFSAQAAFSEWLTSLWQMTGVRVSSTWDNGQWRLSPSAQRFQLKPESAWAPPFHEVMIQYSNKPKDLYLVGLKAEVKAIEGTWQWYSFQAQVPSTGVRLTSIGDWSYGDGISGILATNKSSAKSLERRAWQVEGTWAKPRVKPAGDSKVSQ